MSVDSDVKPVEVDENSNMGTIAEAVRHNSQASSETKTVEAVTQKEVQETHGQEAQAKQLGADGAEGSSLSSRACSSGSSLAGGGNRAAVYGDMAADAVGVTALKVAKMGCDMLRDSDPGKFGGMNTIESMIKGKASKLGGSAEGGLTDKGGLGGGKKGSIQTAHFNDLAGRVNGIGAFQKEPGATKSWGGGKKATAELNQKLQITQARNQNLEQQLGHTKQMESKMGAKVQKAQQMGMAPGLTHDRMAQGPKFKEPRDIPATDTAGGTDWS